MDIQKFITEWNLKEQKRLELLQEQIKKGCNKCSQWNEYYGCDKCR